MIETISNNGLI